MSAADTAATIAAKNKAVPVAVPKTACNDVSTPSPLAIPVKKVENPVAKAFSGAKSPVKTLLIALQFFMIPKVANPANIPPKSEVMITLWSFKNPVTLSNTPLTRL